MDKSLLGMKLNRKTLLQGASLTSTSGRSAPTDYGPIDSFTEIEALPTGSTGRETNLKVVPFE
jgi:hypothetical protein